MTQNNKKQDKGRLIGASYWMTVLLSAIGILLSINQIFNLRLAGFMPIASAYYYYILMFYLSLTFLVFPASRRHSSKVPFYDWILFGLCFVVNFYFAFHAYDILTKGWEYGAPITPMIAGFILWGLALEGVRRATGFSLFVICLVFSFMPVFADHLPGFLWGAYFSLPATACYHAMSVESIIGIPTRVVGDLLIGFIIFGVALVSSGGGDFFMNFAMSLLGHRRGGAAKVAVVSSAFMASLSGSVISNVVTTGSITIPTMKKSGFSPTMAAAVETCASTGGTIMPPIMGAAGFLIASFMNVPYSKVMIAAFLPSMFYYMVLFLQIDCYAVQAGITGWNKEDLPSFWGNLKKGWFFVGSLVLLVFILLYMRNEAWAPFFVMIFLFGCAMIRRETRYSLRKFAYFLVESGRLLAQITAILAGVGLILGALSATGIANSFARELVTYAHGNIALMLFFGALTSFILGIGMTVTACYVFLAIVLVPALTAIGLNEMGSHLFVLYWGNISYITPPVALGAITAATIAGSDGIKTGFVAMRLGIITYIIPFFFVLDPSMILMGPLMESLLSVCTSLIGCVLLACSLGGYLYWFGKIKMLMRIVCFACGMLLMYPDWHSDVVGLIIIMIFILLRSKGFFKACY